MTAAQFLKIRLNAGLSQAQLSPIIGVSARAIYSYEDGTRKVSKPVAILMELVRDRILPQ